MLNCLFLENKEKVLHKSCFLSSSNFNKSPKDLFCKIVLNVCPVPSLVFSPAGPCSISTKSHQKNLKLVENLRIWPKFSIASG